MDFSSLAKFLDQRDKNQIPSCRMAVYREHECLFSYEDAFSEEDRSKDLYYLFSASKVITCTAVLQLIEAGKLGLFDNAEKYLPAFADVKVRRDGKLEPAKRKITVHQLLTMTAGLTYNLGDEAIRKMQAETDHKGTTRQVADAIAQMPLIFEPGEKFNYSLCHDVLAAIVEVVSGQTFGEYLSEHIFAPLGMKDTGFKPTEEALARMTQQFLVNQHLQAAVPQAPSCPYRITENHESGGAGMISSLNDYCLFADALASGSAKNGYQLLKPQTVDLFRADHLTPQTYASFCSINRTGYSYGLGVRTMIDPKAANTKAPVGEFGWDGAAGAYVLIDPDNKLSIVYMQHVLGCGPAYNQIHPALRNRVYDILKG